MNGFKKNSKTQPTAVEENGALCCPRCGAQLARAVYGAYVHGVAVKCRSKGCKTAVYLELK